MGASREIATPMEPVSAEGAPTVDPAMLGRPRLTERLVTGRSISVILLQAPAGYSKSTCFALWDSADERTFCWLSCRSRHDDPSTLVAAIVEALDPVQPVGPEVLLALSSPSPDMATVLDRLGRAIEETPEPFVLVIDDAHLLSEPGTAEVLATVVESLPAGSQLAIGSRTRPDLPLGRLRASRKLAEFGPSELAMTRRECADLFAGLGVELSNEEQNKIFEKTEGWPAALYLAGLVLKPEAGEMEFGDGSLPADGFFGDDRFMVEYFREEFFGGLTEDLASFLYRTSILEELNGPLCDAVCQNGGSAMLLSELSRSNAMVIPLDRNDQRFRYHHLFADMLRSELRMREPEAEKELHRRASWWYREQGDIEHAVGHAIDADDVELAGELFWMAWPNLSGRGRMATLDRWVEEFGDERVKQSIPMMLGLAHRGLAVGDGASAMYWTGLAVTAIESDEANRLKYQGDIDILNATFSINGVERMVSDAESAIRELDPDSPWVTPAYLYAGVGLHLSGSPEEAVPLLEEAVRRGAAASPIIQALALCQLALIAESDRWHDASRQIAQARRQVKICGLESYGSMALVMASAAYQRAREGRVKESRKELEDCASLMSAIKGLPNWYEAEVLSVMARTCVRLGDPLQAETHLAAAREFAKGAPGAPVLEGWIDKVAQTLEASRDGMLAQGTNLTKSELRTLQYLPSHHSFRAIGEQLHLSQNTVKTQANSLYRKLGATSRAQAVIIARQAGLLDDDPR